MVLLLILITCPVTHECYRNLVHEAIHAFGMGTHDEDPNIGHPSTRS